MDSIWIPEEISPGLPSYLSPVAGGPARRWTPAQAAADPDRRLALTRALARRKRLAQVAALAQSNAMLKAGAAPGRALGEDEKSGGVSATAQHTAPPIPAFRRGPHLRPVQGDPLGRAGLVVARLLLDGPVGQALDVLQRLLLTRTDLPDAQNRPGSQAAITRLSAL